jgi:hypothetical protein
MADVIRYRRIDREDLAGLSSLGARFARSRSPLPVAPSTGLTVLLRPPTCTAVAGVAQEEVS